MKYFYFILLKITYTVRIMTKKCSYEKYLKRFLDIVLSLLILFLFWWLYLIIALLVYIQLGNPVVFKQLRPGKNCKIFNIYKFRTMTNEKDDDGKILSDKNRMTPFGQWLRESSLDEIPEVFCVLKGDMSFVGPRPQLVKDMVFMNEEQNKRHLVLPGLTGLAQVNGRNNITWDEKLKYDLEYINNISFINDVKIFFKTFKVALIKKEGITEKGKATSSDFGDYLLNSGRITYDQYHDGQTKAQQLIDQYYLNH